MRWLAKGVFILLWEMFCWLCAGVLMLIEDCSNGVCLVAMHGVG